MDIYSLDYFFKVYSSNYITFPLIIFVKLLFDFFKKLNKFDSYFDDKSDNENEHEYYKNIITLQDENDDLKKNIIVPANFESLDQIKNNKNIYIQKFSKNKYSNNYDCVLAGQTNNLVGFFYIKFFNFVKTIEQIENSSGYSVYMLNLESNQIIIDIQKKYVLDYTFKIFNKYYDIVPHILAYSSKYESSEYVDVDVDIDYFFNNWIKPIEPTDKENYLQLTQNKILTNLEIINGIQYTDIICYRNFLQKDFKSYLDELYKSDNNELQQIPYLYTTYRENSQKQIIMIIH
jgi:hypothetical protein